MSVYQEILDNFSEISNTDDFESLGIFLQDDSDGNGAYIVKWEYEKPIPEGLKLGK